MMSASSLNHRLAAIFAADAAGYSRLMAGDDSATVAALDAARAVFRAHIEAHQGRVVDMAGDAVLAVFGSAAGAVAAALAVQAQINPLADDAAEDRRMRFRIGLHLGDVIEKADGSVYGDGVNIAARLEGLAEPGGIMVSQAIHNAVHSRIDASWVDAGQHEVKNIPYPVRIFRVGPTGMPKRVSEAAITPTARQRPSIAVLPFKVLSDDQSLGFLADGLVEDVIALLARVGSFQLIAQSSSFAFRNQDLGLARIARDLGVRYIVEGSVRPVGEQVRISTQLIEAASALVLWSGRFESLGSEMVNLQDDIARGVMVELEPELIRAEIAIIRRLRPENVDAWGCYHRGVGAIALKGWTEEAIQESRTQLRCAYELAPSLAQAQALHALVTALGCNTGLLTVSPGIKEEAQAAAERAMALDDGSSAVLGFAGCALSDLGERERGVETLQRALAIDPSNAQAHVALGATYGLMGRVDEGLDAMRYGMRISPRDRRLGFWGWALGCLLVKARRWDEALLEARASAGRDPRLHLSRILEAGVLLQLGRDAQARIALAAARRMRPSLTPQEARHTHGNRIGTQLESIWDDT